MSYIEEKRTLGHDKVDTRKHYLTGGITGAEIEALKVDGFTEVYEHSLVLFKPKVDPAQAVADEIASVSEAVTTLLKGVANDTLVEMLDYILVWTQGAYVIGDVRRYNGQPKICCQAHDSTENPTWTPDVASLWSPYHAKSAEYALPWIQPTGVQDMYKVGEYMVFTDGVTYKCIADTIYSPTDYAAAWQ